MKPFSISASVVERVGAMVFVAVMALGALTFLWTLYRIEQTHAQQIELGKATRCVLMILPQDRTPALVRACFRSVRE